MVRSRRDDRPFHRRPPRALGGLGQLVSAARGRVDRLSADDVIELSRLYRVTTGDLAIARHDFGV